MSLNVSVYSNLFRIVTPDASLKQLPSKLGGKVFFYFYIKTNLNMQQTVIDMEISHRFCLLNYLKIIKNKSHKKI